MSAAKRKEAKPDNDELQAALKGQEEAERRLRAKEEEFAEFILMAAHDLREPLRAVTIYSQFLAKMDPARTEGEAAHFRDSIQAGTTRIQSLIAGMAEWATASEPVPYQLKTDMNQVFREAEAVPARQPGQRTTEVDYGPLPIVHGDFEKLVKVARHLLDNAARYSDRDDTRIHVSAKPEGSGWRFAVRDNGPGIEESYWDRIFEPFKRLHGREYVGNGLGLAFCRKVIEAHGGRIWVESEPGAGSTFCFTLP